MPGDTEIIKKGVNVKEVREWLTLLFTILIFPVGYLFTHSLTMDIKADVAKEYVTKAAYTEDRNGDRQRYSEDQQRLASERTSDLQTLGNIQGKLESLQISQIHDADTLALIKEQLSSKRAP